MKIIKSVKEGLVKWFESYGRTYLKDNLELGFLFIIKDYYNIGGPKELILSYLNRDPY